MKNKMTRLGYIFGAFVLFPLLLMIVNFIFFRGNAAKNIDITKYINDSKIDTVVIPKDMVNTWQQYTAWFARGGGGIKNIEKYTFYSSEYKKYLQLLTFDKFDTNYTERNIFLDPVLYGIDSIDMMFSVRINQQQFNDPIYGTKENPVPVFAMDLLDPPSPYQYGGGVQENIHIPDTLNRIFVGQYLNRFMPKAEFKKMFRQ